MTFSVLPCSNVGLLLLVRCVQLAPTWWVVSHVAAHAGHGGHLDAAQGVAQGLWSIMYHASRTLCSLFRACQSTYVDLRDRNMHRYSEYAVHDQRLPLRACRLDCSSEERLTLFSASKKNKLFSLLIRRFSSLLYICFYFAPEFVAGSRRNVLAGLGMPFGVALRASMSF